MAEQIFSLRGDLPSPLLSTPLERLLGLKALERVYDSIPPCRGTDEFLRASLDQLGIRLELNDEDLARVPDSGPVVVVANHPYGGVEGMALALALSAVRSDVRVMANFFLGRIPELKELFFLVDPFERPSSPRRNLAALRQALRWLSDGGLVVIFPAGEVAHLDLRSRRVTDPLWLPTVARIVRRSEASVVPVYFCGHNGPLFQIAGLIHPTLRTALLPRELLAHRGLTLRARIGGPIPFRQLKGLDDRETTAYLRRRTENLAERPSARTLPRPVQPRRTPAAAAAIIEPVPARVLESEVAALPPDALLVDEGEQQVWVAGAQQIPRLLTEIGRLRELSFRAVGEGTGRALDIDRFDAGYRHLFVWHRSLREVVGAYRIGHCDRILATEGFRGLYTSTLFRFSQQLFERMGPALEMGRSFIRPEHQRSFNGLLLLWKGLARYVLQQPDYHTLFGPVSISADYQSASQQLIATFLKQNNFGHRWSRWVRPRSPFRAHGPRSVRFRAGELRDLDDVSAFIADIETDRKGVPVLLRQYLKLGGRLLGFNVDPDFAHVLDVLIMVDLRQTPARVLSRYMGADGAARFHARHGAGEAEAAAVARR